MAITIHQRPSSPNYSYGDLVYVLSSTEITQTEFAFVAEVTIGTDTFTFRKVPNPTSRGVFNISEVINNNLDWEVAALGLSTEHTYVSQAKTFSIVFKEEWKGQTPTNATSSESLTVIKGVVENDVYLTNGEISSLTGALTSVTSGSDVIAGRKYGITNVIETSGDYASTQYDTFTATSGANSVTVGSTTYTFNSVVDNGLGLVEFFWFNRKGGIDWFVATESSTEPNTVDKSTYANSSTHVGFTTALNRESSNINVWKAQESVYRVSSENTFTKNTKWLTKSESDYVSGIFESPRVFVRQNDLFRPVLITNTSYDAQVEGRNSDLFNYTIEYKFANNKRTI